jgi:hypothetical protein
MQGGLKYDDGKLDLSVLGTNFTPYVMSFGHQPDLGPLLPWVDLFWHDYAVSQELSLHHLERALSLVSKHDRLDAIGVFEFGAKKYGRLNYARGIEVYRLIAAFRRHAWYYPCVLAEKLDAETGKSHTAHAVCCLLMILEQFSKNTK